MNPRGPDTTVIEAVLIPEGDGTRLVVEERGLPVAELPSYGAGWQAHLEDLARHVGGRDDVRVGRPVDGAHTALSDARTQRMSGLDERTAILHYLRAQRRSVLSIVDGLDDQQMNTSVVASSWTPAGLLEAPR